MTAWSRTKEIERLRTRLWLHVTPAAGFEDGAELRATAAALLQLSRADLRTLERVHFLLDDAVGTLVDALPDLTRRLTTTTLIEEEVSAERIRGPINWSRTISTQAATAMPHVYVTEPARRAFNTPENELLAFMLDRITEHGDQLGWNARRRHAGGEISRRVDLARRWRRRRGLGDVPGLRPTGRTLGRIRHGRHRRRYAPVLDAYASYMRLIGTPGVSGVRDAIEKRGLAAADNPTLFEIRVAFDVLDALRADDWELTPLSLFGPGRALRANGKKNGRRVEFVYQHAPKALRVQSRYRDAVKAHGLNASTLRPDFVLRVHDPKGSRWIIGEVKLTDDRDVGIPVRRALKDLLAYRRDFDAALLDESEPYGIGVGWGRGLEPASNAEVLLCTPDHVHKAVQLAVGGSPAAESS